MTLRRFALPILVAIAVGACGSDPPPPPAPTGPTDEELAQARADSIARAQAEAERRAAEERAAREAEEARMAAMEDARETLQAMVFFDLDESAITDQAAAVLRRKVDVLRASPQVQIRIEGHADERGSTEYNLALGNRRAQAVREFLTGFGLPESRFTIVSYGEEQPLVNQSNESAWSQNRRAEFEITAGANAINPPS